MAIHVWGFPVHGPPPPLPHPPGKSCHRLTVAPINWQMTPLVLILVTATPHSHASPCPSSGSKSEHRQRWPHGHTYFCRFFSQHCSVVELPFFLFTFLLLLFSFSPKILVLSFQFRSLYLPVLPVPQNRDTLRALSRSSF